MSDATAFTEDQYGELITTLVEEEMRHYGYTDEEIAAAEQATHTSAGCELQGYEWLCQDENGKPNHPVWDELDSTVEIIGRVLESKALAAKIRQAKAEALREAIDEDSRRIPDALGYKVHVVFVEDLDSRAARIAGGDQG